MIDPSFSELSRALDALDPSGPRFATDAVDQILQAGRRFGASDIHLRPAADSLEIRWRIDGVLRDVARLPARLSPNVVARLKVLAELLTYRTDVPQEGRIRLPGDSGEMRLCTFPTLHGEKAVVRLFGGISRFTGLPDLGWPDEVRETISSLLDSTSGAILFSGPAGSGKTTAIYASLRDLADRCQGSRSLTSLEDPIELAIEGVAQSQVNLAAGLTLETGLRSLLRQDPEVIAIGEIRDRETAETSIQASLTGHLILTTFHAGDCCEVIGRLLDMGIEPYMVRSGLIAVVAQRLVRRLCECSESSDKSVDAFGIFPEGGRAPVGCKRCAGSGYRGRVPLVELLLPENEQFARGILDRRDVRALRLLAVEQGMHTLWDRGRDLVAWGLTSPSEVLRVLGPRRDETGTDRKIKAT